MLSAYRGSRSRPSVEGASASETAEAPMTVLPSSTELFYFYAQTLEQCGRYTNGKGMKDLADVFKKWLRIFSGKSRVVSLVVCSKTEISHLCTQCSDDVLIASMKKLGFHVIPT